MINAELSAAVVAMTPLMLTSRMGGVIRHNTEMIACTAAGKITR